MGDILYISYLVPEGPEISGSQLEETASGVETENAAASDENLLEGETVEEPEPPEPEPMSVSWLGVGVGAALLLAAAVVFIIWRIRSKRKKVKTEDEKPAVSAQPSEQTAQQAIGPIAVSVGKLHEQGARSGQQDCFAVSDSALIPTHGLLAVVADGMGGLENGDQVSRTAVEAMLDGFTMSPGAGTPEQLLLLLAERANSAVNRFLGAENFRKSGSTMVAGLIRDNAFSYVSIGDSRICLYRGGQLIQLNREHIYRNELALGAVNGDLPLREVFQHPKGAGLTSFLGMGKLKIIDIPAQPVTILPGDKFILMSDGVYNALNEQEIKAALRGNAEDAAEALRTAIQAKGYSNQDNYTAVILTCDTGSTPSPQKVGSTIDPSAKQ